MSIKLNLQHLVQDELVLKGDIPAAELDYGFTDEVVQAREPLQYRLTAQKMEDAVLVQGSLVQVFDCQCVRCLKAFQYRLELVDWACHLPLSGEEAATVSNDCVDLTPHIREDILLGLPQHPVCKPECSGLTSSPGGKSKPASSPKATLSTPAWSELDKLKL
jgi:uncharacterized protein